MAAIFVALNSCADGLAPLSKVPTPTTLTIEAVKLGTMRLSWEPVSDPDVVGYSIERRVNLSGPFLPYVDQIPQSSLEQIVYLDTNLEPDTFYGYRLITTNRFGERSSPSVVTGMKSPPLPGIEVSTATLLPSSESIDPDGYELTILGPDTVHQTIGVAAMHRFSPMRLGDYQVSIGGIVDRCESDGPSTQTVTVTDQTPQTVVPVAFKVTCRDPRLGEITVTVTSTGTAQDGQHTISLLGQASDATLPDSLRIVARTGDIGSASGSTRFVNLPPGTYDIMLEGLEPNCTLEGAATRSVTVAALDRKTVNLNVSCTSPGGGGGGNQGPGYQYRATWTALSNGEYALELKIDMTTFNRADIDDITTNGVSGDPLTGAQLTLAYDPSLLVYDRSETPSVPFIAAEPTINGSEVGFVSLLAGTTVLKTGNMEIVRLIFTRAPGSSTGSVTTVTTLRSVTSRSAGATLVITPDVRINEGTIAVGPGGGGGGGTPNQSPTANANGPYAGTANTPLLLSSAGSSDPDGTIASYSWSLGNGQSATGASPSVTYSAAGTYTAILTVTDNQGATATSQATVTISGSGGGAPNQSPTARANGPYSGTVNTPFSLSSAGSSDPDGTIASYSWALGNGQTATGASPSVTYSAAGTFTAVLTVTDDKGATGTSQATVTVSNPAPTKPLTWKNVFGPIDVANNQVSITVSYDLRGNVPETPGVEELATFKVDSLKWDPAVLQFSSINLGPNITGTSNQAKAAAGNLAFQGTTSGALAQGLITIATIRFKLVGTPGSRTTTATALGALQGSAATGDFVYNSKTAIVEGEHITP